MSFTSEVKHEICQYQVEDGTLKAQLCGLLLCKASIHMNWQGMYLSYQTENATIAKHIFKLIKTQYHTDPRLSILKKMKLKKNNIYRLQIYENVETILDDLTILTSTGLHAYPNYKIVRSEKNSRAFLSGCFLASGSVNDPKSSNYHLEMSCSNEKLAEFIKKQMERFYIPSKIVERKGLFVVYVKVGEKIADFLRLVNASGSLFEFEDVRIQRDLYNQITRLDNCELANEVKSMNAAKKQLAAIEVIEKNLSKDQIPEAITQTMAIRKKFPEASITELCTEMLIAYGKSISKSGMKHRLNKIRDMASAIEENKKSKEE